MVCRSEATLQVLPMFPRSFMDTGQGGFFKEKQYQANNLRICGVNRAKGQCQGQFSILLDDWALATRDELRECRVQEMAIVVFSAVTNCPPPATTHFSIYLNNRAFPSVN
jgi:hypothetical protein